MKKIEARFFVTLPMWQVVWVFPFCRSEGYIVHYQTFGRIPYLFDSDFSDLYALCKYIFSPQLA